MRFYSSQERASFSELPGHPWPTPSVYLPHSCTMICSCVGSPTMRSRGRTPVLNLPLYPYHLSQWWPPGQYKVNIPWMRNGLHNLSLTEAHAVNFIDLSSNRSLITSQLCVQGPTYSYTISSSFSSNSRNASPPKIPSMSVTVYRHFEGMQSNQGKKIRAKGPHTLINTNILCITCIFFPFFWMC